MKKRWVFPFVVLLFAVGSEAQQNTFPSTGNVGIGTTAPVYPVTINNATSTHIDLAGGSSQNGILFEPVSGADSFYLYSGNTNNAPGFGLYDNTASAWRLFVNNGGNVGIQMTSIEHRLEVVSNQGVGINEWSPHGVVVASADPITDPNSTMIWMDTDKTNNIGYIQAYQRGIGARPLVLQAGPGGSGNVGIGTTNPGAPLEVNGSIKLTANSGASITFPDGTYQATAWNGVLSGGDYAESVDVQGDRNSYQPGDVLVINPEVEGGFVLSSHAYSTAVMGIYSTKPGVRGRRQKTDLSHMKEEVPMAMVGIVPTKVSAENGPIHPGDLLVTSSRRGYAMKGTDRSQMLGAVIGKALGHLDSGTGVIEVGVTLQ